MNVRSDDSTSICFCYMMDLLGILTEKMPKAYFKHYSGSGEKKSICCDFAQAGFFIYLLQKI